MIARNGFPPSIGLALLLVVGAACADGPEIAVAANTASAAADFEHQLARLKGRTIGEVHAALGRADSARPLPGGSYVIAWNRDGAPAPVGGSAAGWRECTILGAVTRHGVVSDLVALGDAGLCAATFKRLP